jgi:hypothetical protein
MLYLGASMGLSALHLLRDALRLPAYEETPLRRDHMPWLGAVILVGAILGPLFLMYGLTRTEAATFS